MSVTAIAAVAVLTLVAVVHSPAAKAGSGQGTTGSGSTVAHPTPTTLPPTTVQAMPTTALPTMTTPAIDPTSAVAEAVRDLGVHGHLSVAVAEADGSGKAVYDSSDDTAYDTASIVKVDILASLLLRDQKSGTHMTAYQRKLAE
jgi:hypothetical protein